MSMIGKRILKTIILVVLLAAVVFGGAAGWVYSEFTRPGPLEQKRAVVVPVGGGVKSIAQNLAENGVIRNVHVFELGARLTDGSGSLRAGEFSFPAGASARDVIDILRDGKTIHRRMTIAEGLSSFQIVSQLNNTEGLVGSILIIPDEGSLLPETYYFSFGDKRSDVVERMQQGMREAISSMWGTRQEGLPFKSPQEVAVLASIVEKETGLPAERARVASVFINRLRLKMRLQSDPTVVYGVTQGREALGRSLTKADLKKPTPYNTYVIGGLPPEPIANPGLASIQAVLNPLSTKDLYFVADGTGGHAFARTLKEHNRNVRKWRKIKAQQNTDG